MRAPLTLLLGLVLLSACPPVPPVTTQSASPVATSAQTFIAELSGNNETPAVSTSARGYGVFMLNAAHDTLTMQAHVAGMSGPITGAHLHLGVAGKSGEVVQPLQVSGNLLTGSWKRSNAEQPLSEARVNSLFKGEFYLNVHTARNPGGEIRGQLSSSSDQVFLVNLSGSQQVPPVSGSASGVAWARLRADQKELTLKGEVFGLSGEVSAAHLHEAAKGSSGTVIKDVDVQGSRLSLSWKDSDAVAPLTPYALNRLNRGELYLNVHTAAQPNGEIRGQLEKPSAPVEVPGASPMPHSTPKEY